MRHNLAVETLSTDEAIAEVNQRLGTRLHRVTYDKWIHGYRDDVPQPSVLIPWGVGRTIRRWTWADVDRLERYLQAHPSKRTGRPRLK